MSLVAPVPLPERSIATTQRNIVALLENENVIADIGNSPVLIMRNSNRSAAIPHSTAQRRMFLTIINIIARPAVGSTVKAKSGYGNNCMLQKFFICAEIFSKIIRRDIVA